jgi:hypothetical protein
MRHFIYAMANKILSVNVEHQKDCKVAEEQTFGQVFCGFTVRSTMD